MADITPIGRPDITKGSENGPGSNKGRNETVEHLTISSTPDEFIVAQNPQQTPLQEARNTNTAPARLAELSGSSDIAILLAVGGNTSTPPAALTSLTRHRPVNSGGRVTQVFLSPAIIALVGENPSTPMSTLRELAGNENSSIRWGVARNRGPNVPRDLLQTLARDTDRSVVGEAQANLARRR